MKLIRQQTIQESLSVSYQIEKIGKSEIDLFKKNLLEYLSKINPAEHEENAKYPVRDFLRDTFFKDKNEINTKGRIDFAVYQGDQPVVIIETKRPSTKTDPDMVQAGNLKAKAMYQLVLYFLEERVQHNNINIKYLVATNMHEWFIFDAALFEKLFFKNKTLVKDYSEWRAKAKVSSDNDLFYKQIAKPVVEELEPYLAYTYFDIRDAEKLIKKNTKEADNKLALYFKVFSPRHLLKETARNDSNQLNKEFYNELLHIIGLEEIKDGGKKRIDRKKKELEEGSLLENTINILQTRNKLQNIDNLNQYGEKEEGQLFSVALELCITWLNRVLFLKLLEGQLITFHRNDLSYAFLNTGKIADFDELDELFFEVLAVPQAKRSASVIKKFGNIPYLNSSLFETSVVENSTLRIADLKDRLDLSVYSGTVLKDNSDNRFRGKKNTLQYLFEFLNAYDFASEDTENVVVETKKDVINASVLGLIFEKINGYKDGSFFTPGFITEYMCRESLRRAVTEKFKAHEATIESFEDVGSYVRKFYKKEDLIKFNQTVNSIKICDPAVGSGHFLVSALNELLVIKSELGILVDTDGQSLEYLVKIENDTLLVTHRSTNEPFNYLLDKDGTPPAALQKVQQALFHEKQKLIEGCLFGVDINPKSVMICRLRLWIELLKHAYYITDGKTKRGGEFELQTLPNIDINIKHGNSLISRFKTNFSITDFKNNKVREIFLRKFKQYSVDVFAYKECREKTEKDSIRKRLLEFQYFINDLFKLDLAEYKNIKKLEEEMGQTGISFNYTNQDKAYGKKVEEMQEEIEKGHQALNNKLNIYQNAFEWRFEFPEVLDDKGDYVGFDVVIGNPPYIRQESIKEIKPYLKSNYEVYTGTADLLIYFLELSLRILRNQLSLSMIVSNKFMKADYGHNLRSLLTQHQIDEIIDFGELPVFDEASTFPVILNVTKNGDKPLFTFAQVKSLDFVNLNDIVASVGSKLKRKSLKDEWILADENNVALMEKLKSTGISLSDYLTKTKIVYGLKTGYNDAFFIDEETKSKLIGEDKSSEKIIVPLAVGDDIRRYHIDYSKKHLILTKIGVDIKSYPAIKNHLDKFKSRLEARSDKGKYWWELRPCDYYESFLSAKIVYPIIAKEPRFAFSVDEMYFNDKTFFIPTKDFFLLGYLNSKLAWFYLKKICSVLGDPEKGGRLELRTIYMETLPVPKVKPQQAKEIAQRVEKILALKTKDQSTNINALEDEIDQIVYKLYNLTPDEVQIIEGK